MLTVAKFINLIPAPVRLWWFGPYISETSLNKMTVMDFIRDDRSSFDLVLFENFFHECFAAIGHKYGAPVVQLLPSSTDARVSQWHANPYGPAYLPDMASRYASNMSFAQRTANAAAAFFYTVANRAFYLPRHRQLANRYFVYPGHEHRPDLTDMLRNISLTLINSHPVIGSPAPMVPTYINVAGMHCVPSSQLPQVMHDIVLNSNFIVLRFKLIFFFNSSRAPVQDLKRIMDDSDRGVVYFSLGSVVKSSKMPNETVALLLSELSKIEQTVLWKWEAEQIPQLPKNVIVRKWFPQNDILGT
jgi:glucuronosyltransferase